MTSDASLAPRGSGFYAGSLIDGERIQHLYSAAAQGISANRALAALRAAGVPIGRDAGLAIYREARGTVGSGASLQNTPYGFRPSSATARPVAYNLGADFLVRARVALPGVTPDVPRFVDASFKYRGELTREEINAALLDVMTPRLKSEGLVDDDGNPLIESGEIEYTSFIRQG